MLKPTYLSDEYLVSDEGFVLSKRGKKLKPSTNPRGYQIVNFMIDGKRVGTAVHILVARAFCEGYQQGLTVNHKDGNKKNNSASNLEWLTGYANTRHAIEVLGYDKKSIKNPNAKSIYAYDKKTGLFVKSFGCIMDAVYWLYPEVDYKKAHQISGLIIRVAKGIRQSYKGFLWRYDKL